MRGGRNKFGPMYKRDRARKLQVLRQRQVLHPGSGGSGALSTYGGLSSTSTSSSSNNPMYTSPLHIKQEIQIPQVTSMTSSPDSSPSPVQLQQQPQQAQQQHAQQPTSSASSVVAAAAGVLNHAVGAGGGGQIMAQQTDPNTGGVQWQISTSPQTKVNQRAN